MSDASTKRSYSHGKLHVVGGTRVTEEKRVRVDQECVDCLTDLAAAACAGDLIGIAYVAMYKGRGFIVNTAGELRRSPTFARGCVAALDDELSEMAWGSP